MVSYTSDDVLVLAKRHHNTKRTYLLVNPLQAKHLPVSPAKSLEMMTCLGTQIAKKYPSASLVIGFAETATAIAAAAAACLSPGCKYIHTTREPYGNISEWIYFNEEHSHAVEQKLYARNLAQWISDTPQIIFIDDEISTGKTLLNIIKQLRDTFPEAKTKQIIAASVINRLSPEHENRFSDAGIEREFLVKLEGKDLTEEVAHYDIASPKPVCAATGSYEDNIIYTEKPLINPRLGVDILEYTENCNEKAKVLRQIFSGDIQPDSNILVLGTEECMYPALLLGRELERNSFASTVSCHATTRSPIGICNEPSYPIHSGYKIHSFYEMERETYIYNITGYDMAVVLTDTENNDLQAQLDLSKVLRENGCGKVFFIEGGKQCSAHIIRTM